jgi:hypothetical protein
LKELRAELFGDIEGVWPPLAESFDDEEEVLEPATSGKDE